MYTFIFFSTSDDVLPPRRRLDVLPQQRHAPAERAHVGIRRGALIAAADGGMYRVESLGLLPPARAEDASSVRDDGAETVRTAARLARARTVPRRSVSSTCSQRSSRGRHQRPSSSAAPAPSKLGLLAHLSPSAPSAPSSSLRPRSIHDSDSSDGTSYRGSEQNFYQ